MRRRLKWLWIAGGIVLFLLLYVAGPHGFYNIIKLRMKKERLKKEIFKKKIEYEMYNLKLTRLKRDKDYYNRIKDSLKF